LYDAAVVDQPELQTTENPTYATIQKKDNGGDFKVHSFKNKSFAFGD